MTNVETPSKDKNGEKAATYAGEFEDSFTKQTIKVFTKEGETKEEAMARVKKAHEVR